MSIDSDEHTEAEGVVGDDIPTTADISVGDDIPTPEDVSVGDDMPHADQIPDAGDASDEAAADSAEQPTGPSLRAAIEAVMLVVDAPVDATTLAQVCERPRSEVEATLARATEMKAWLQMARECGCDDPAECSLFRNEADLSSMTGGSLPLVDGDGCRR